MSNAAAEPHEKDIGRKPATVYVYAAEGVHGTVSGHDYDHVEVNDGYVFCNDDGNITYFPMHRVAEVERTD